MYFRTNYYSSRWFCFVFEFCTGDNIHSPFHFFQLLKKAPNPTNQPNWKWNKTNKPQTNKKPAENKTRKGFCMTGNIISCSSLEPPYCQVYLNVRGCSCLMWLTCEILLKYLYHLASSIVTDPFKGQSRNVMLWPVGCSWYFCSSVARSEELGLREDESTAGFPFLIFSDGLLHESLSQIHLHYYRFCSPNKQSFAGFKHLFQCKSGKSSGVLCWHANA